MKLWNTLTNSLETFHPKNAHAVTLYVCGITPYDTTHLGHAFTYVSFDMLFRYLQYKGFVVSYTQNVTDINDRDTDILERAKEQGIAWNKLATYWTNHFLKDMQALNWVFPTHYLKASEQLPVMILLIQHLLKRHKAYQINGSVYLDISKDKEFGKLSKLDKKQMLVIAKDFEEDIENPEKKQPLDITLWRATKYNQPPHIPSFPSPFGKGRPGWHIECSAMAIGSLGEQIDIHGGGKDLIYPHHESEITQSEGATDKKPFAKYWMHSGVVGLNGEKMSKSLGNLIMVSDLLKKFSANAIRLYLLTHHYRSSWDYKQADLEKVEKMVNKWKQALYEKSQDIGNKDNRYLNNLLKPLENDLDTPTAIKECNQLAESILEQKDKEKQEALFTGLTVLGLRA